jgi:hypothetical protein
MLSGRMAKPYGLVAKHAWRRWYVRPISWRTTLQSMSPRQWSIQPPPLWLRWAVAIVVAVALLIALVNAIHRAGPDGATSEAGAEAEVNRLADIAITEDEAPHVATLSAGSAPAALTQAITADVRQRISSGQLTGPFQGVACKAAGAGGANGAPYRCTVRSAGIAYPFLAVVDTPLHRLTWCKFDQPASGGQEIPVSDRCRA